MVVAMNYTEFPCPHSAIPHPVGAPGVYSNSRLIRLSTPSPQWVLLAGYGVTSSLNNSG